MNMTKNKANLKELFFHLQDEMKLSLSNTRKSHMHPVTTGDLSEYDWVTWLKNHLPSRYKVDKAFAIDCRGQLSDQLDLVIYDNFYCPLVFKKGDAKYIPIESIYAIFEVKQELTKEHIAYAANKIASVRNLSVTNRSIKTIEGKETKKVTSSNIIGGILTTKGYKKKKTLNTNVLEHTGLKTIDIGCAIENCSFLNINGAINCSGEEDILLYFFMHLFDKLQNMFNPPVIDTMQYFNPLFEK